MYRKYAKLRDEKGYSDYFVAHTLGIPKSSFSAWKAGNYSPKADKLYKLAKFFGVPMEYFMEE